MFRRLPTYAFAFDDSDVTVDGKIREALYFSAGQRPLNLQPIEFLVGADPKHDRAQRSF
jgi:hypothetical protein